jgi:arylformamidase
MNRSIRLCYILLLLIGTLQLAHAADKPKPDLADVVYGSEDRNVLDVYLAKTKAPSPVMFVIHGGGWLNGSKEGVHPNIVKSCLSKGITVVSINYRYSSMAPLPAPVHDAVRALQFVRSKAKAWNISKDRIVSYGVSAGGCTSIWLALHDDMADPNSHDPIERESTRVIAAVGRHAQTSIDPKVIKKWIGDEVATHPMIYRCVGAADVNEMNHSYDDYKADYFEFSPINHITKDDPPLFLLYNKDDVIPPKDINMAIHHNQFGIKLKQAAANKGVDYILSFNVSKMNNFLDAILLEKYDGDIQ